MPLNLLTKILQQLVFLFAVLFPHQLFSAAEPLIVAEYSWTSNVVGMQPTDRLPTVISPQPPIYHASGPWSPCSA